MKKIILGLMILITANAYAQTPQPVSTYPTATGRGEGSFLYAIQGGVSKKLLIDSINQTAKKYADSINALVNAQVTANIAAIQQRADSFRNNAGVLEVRKNGAFIPQFTFPVSPIIDSQYLRRDINNNTTNISANTAGITTKQNLINLTTTGTGSATFIPSTGALNIPISSGGGGGGSGIDSLSYHFVTPLPDSTGFVLTKPNGTKDTVLVNLGPGAGSYVPNTTNVSNLNNFTGAPSAFSATTPTNNPSGAIGPVVGFALPHPSAAGYGGIILSDQEGNLFTKKNNTGTTWGRVITDQNIATYAPPATGLTVVSGTAPGTYPTVPQIVQNISGTAPTGSIGQLGGLVLPHNSAANYGGIIASDQSGNFYVKTNNSPASWRSVLDELNVSNFALTPTTGVAYKSTGDANAWTGNAIYYSGGTNIPSTATGLTGINFPYINLSNYGNQLSFERYGKLYTRNNNGGTFGAWKQIAQYIEGTATYTPPLIASLGTTTTTISVTGAVLGNYAHVSFSLSLAGLIATAYVSAADVVTIVLFNPTTTSITLGSTTIKAKAE